LGTLGGNQGWAEAINISGQVVGYAQRATITGVRRAFLKNPGEAMVDLGTLGGGESRANDINDAGQVVGRAFTASEGVRAFLKNPGQGMVNLGTFGGTQSSARDINKLGQVVGWAYNPDNESRAFLWEKGVLYNLNDLAVNLPPGIVLRGAEAINDQGWIVGSVTSDITYLLTPAGGTEPGIVVPLLLLD